MSFDKLKETLQKFLDPESESEIVDEVEGAENDLPWKDEETKTPSKPSVKKSKADTFDALFEEENQ